MAPPKRKGGGRVTPKGTRPGESRLPTAGAPPVRTNREAYHAAESSSRYTPPVPKYVKESPRWVPYLMFAFWVAGALVIMGYYLSTTFRHNWVLFGGLAMILAGLYTATKYH